MTFSLESRAAGRSSRFAEPLLAAQRAAPDILKFLQYFFTNLVYITGTQRQQHIAGLQDLF